MNTVISGIKNLVRKLLRWHVTEEDIQSIIDEGEQEGVINRDEHAMIDAVLDLDDTRVREILVPRTDMVALEKDTPLGQVLETIIEAGHSRIPVFDGDIDHIIGILYAKDLLKIWGYAPEAADLSSMLRRAYYIPESKSIGDLLKEFKTRHVHMAVAVDEYGGTSGLVTIEDILEEIVGEIQDEFDLDEQTAFTRLEGGGYLFDARSRLEDVEEEVGVSLPRGDYDTLGGFVSHIHGHLPVKGEQCHFETLLFTVEDADARKISSIRVERSQDEG